jgi:predicted ATP-grasp superfamily ATP-dependent carboligase
MNSLIRREFSRQLQLFVYEYLSATGLRTQPGAKSLRTEGLAMLSAVMEDFAGIPGVEALTLIHEESLALGNRWPYRVCRGDDEALFRSMAAGADYTLVVAPEYDGLLEMRSRRVLEEGGRLLGSFPEAVQLAADKWRLARHLQERGIRTPPTVSIEEAENPNNFPLVIKPRHGAGSQATFLIPQAAAWPSVLARFRAECPADGLLLQRFVPGFPVSVAFLVGPRQRMSLLPAAQHLSEDGRFHYRGGAIPLPAFSAERAVRLAERALVAVPGLQGYFGVDLVLGEAADGSRDYVIEINPRLTTSYTGLRILSENNLAEAMLRVVQGEMVGPLRWRQATVRFQADGSYTVGPPELRVGERGASAP